MKTINWIIALLGLWELGDIALPFVIGFGKVQAFVWNHILVGMILAIAGARAAITSDVGMAKSMNGIAAVAGAWLLIASLLLPALAAAARWNDVVVGAAVLILSQVSGLVLQGRR